MSNGLLNKIVATGSLEQVAEIPANVKFASVHIRAANPNANVASLTIFATTSVTPSAGDLIEPGAQIPSQGRYSDECGIMSPGEKIFVNTAAGVVVRVEIISEPADEV